ncbi:MAG: glycerophosphoryl diester phosphodiesterase membrane domain-containing protein [Candidatus Methanofastidiosia archaeon]|jgi:hypothetical protein
MEQYLKPMGLGEILDASVKLYRKNFWTLVIAKSPMTAMYLITVGINLWFLGSAGSSFFDILSGMSMSPASPVYPASPATPSFATLIYVLLVLLVLVLIQIVFVYPVSMSAVTKVASESILETPSLKEGYTAPDSAPETPSLKEAYIFSLKNWFKLGITHVVVIIVVSVAGGIAIVIPMFIIAFGYYSMAFGAVIVGIIFLLIAFSVPVFLGTRWITVFPVMVNEQKFIGDAMSRSWDMVKGHTIKIFFAIVILALIPILIQQSPGFLEIYMGRSLALLTVIFGVVAQGVITPLVDCERAVVYFELRARKEGFDLEKRVEQLE